MLNIQPITLLKGSHDNTAATGQGCFMNVIAYLNGESQITDHSPCVCEVVRPIVIQLNDATGEERRQRLLPFIERAMGSATADPVELARRAELAVQLATAARADMVEVRHGPDALAYADQRIAEARRYLAFGGFKEAGFPVAVVLSCASPDMPESIFEAGLKFLDAALPPAPVWGDEVQARARELVRLAVA
jgi:hypothetical protein